MKSRIMYIESKKDGINGPARIGKVTFSKTGKTIYYKDKEFQNFRGYKANYFDVETSEEYWISGYKKNGGDRLYSGIIEIDEDAVEEYWTDIRGKPECRNQKIIHCDGKYKG